ncbi:MAG: hypothetical protein LBH59_00520 [Planctomycetaceae bacterium]|nr:hypothetical protein [Planctomycetaceae bacterium]
MPSLTRKITNIPKPVWAVGFALEQTLRDATLPVFSFLILKRLQHIKQHTRNFKRKIITQSPTLSTGTTQTFFTNFRKLGFRFRLFCSPFFRRLGFSFYFL